MKDYTVEVKSWGDTEVYLCRQCKDEAEAKGRVKERYAKMHIKISDRTVNGYHYTGIYIYSVNEVKDGPIIEVASFSAPDEGYDR
jgi:hypothetical protein